jgi:hypothetical protein
MKRIPISISILILTLFATGFAALLKALEAHPGRRCRGLGM